MNENLNNPELSELSELSENSNLEVFNKIVNISNSLPEQCTDEWLEFRKNRLTGSDLATAIGTNPYSNSKSLLLQKVTNITSFKGNEATEWGKKYESEAIKMYEIVSGEKVEELNIIPHSDIDFLAYSPDGLTIPIKKPNSNFETFKLIEIKCPMKRKIDESIPEHYYAQVQLGLHTLYKYGIDTTCDFIEYCPYDNELNKPFQLKILNIKRSQEWWDANESLIYEFWENVKKYRKIKEESNLTVEQITELINKDYKIIKNPNDHVSYNSSLNSNSKGLSKNKNKNSNESFDNFVNKNKIIDNNSGCLFDLLMGKKEPIKVIKETSKVSSENPIRVNKESISNNINLSELLNKLKINNKKMNEKANNITNKNVSIHINVHENENYEYDIEYEFDDESHHNYHLHFSECVIKF